ncbi:MAG: protein jag [Oscillospiraceae bacterium]|nr:protein jag [Oscillospiraceae bacterium]MCL2279596.1 protein jag [Oscillospiraceae bacterium]
MTKSIEVQGRTEDEAIELALEQLNLSRDDVSVEIIEQAKTGFLGLKSTPAIVKVSYEAKEEGPQKIESFLTGLLKRMDIEAGFDISEKEDSVEVNLTGSDPGVLIGRRGETLDAIQHLTNYVVNRGASERIRINFDTEGYRQRRSESLENLAGRTAGKVVKYRKNMTLDPMNAYERHIIHAALQDNAQISTFSIGSEPNRRVVVAYGNKSQKSDRSSGFRSESHRSHAPRQSTPRSEAPRSEAPRSEGTKTYREWS